ncbi:MAG TPA: TolC family outer membrane protein [Rhizomicrobium sp.]|jgi:TolC family type I secretion outer membrane protein|nr:TolC family outer membrane protein [Rhizomicrobium sp.]
MRSGLVYGVAGALAFALSLGVCQAETLTLKQALALAYETNPQLAGARAGVRAVDEGVATANAAWRPTINASGSYGVQNGQVTGFASAFNSHPLTGAVTVTQQVFRGGRTYAEIGRAIALVHSARAELADTEREILLDAVTSYLDVVRDSNVMALNQANVRTLQAELDAANTQHGAGAITRTDVDQAQARLSRAQADLAAAQRQYMASREAFDNVIGRPAGTLEAAPVLPAIPATVDTARNIGVQRSPKILQAKADWRAADYAVSDAIGALLPQLSIQGQYEYLRDAAGTNIFATKDPQQILSVTGQVTVPIYQGGAEDAEIRRAKELRGQSQLAISTAQRAVWQDVGNAWDGYRSAQLEISANDAQVTADQSALDGVKQEQEAGERSVLDILNAQQELLSAQVAATTARHDAAVAAYRVLWAIGQLDARDLALPVKYYDPAEHYEDDAGAWTGFGD